MSLRDRRALLLGGAAVAAALLALRVLPWVARSALASQRELTARTALLAESRAIFASEPALTDSVAVLKAQVLALAPKLLGGSTPGEASARLLGLVNLAASRHGVRVERLDQAADTVGAIGAGRFRRAVVRAELETDAMGLAGLLDALQSDPALMVLRRLNVLATDPSSAESLPEVLRVEVEVEGWYLTRGDSAAESGPADSSAREGSL